MTWATLVFFGHQAKLVRLAIKTPDQKTLLVTPMSSHLFKKDSNCRRLLTNAIMSHQVPPSTLCYRQTINF